jgi:hypothetical protein
MQSVRGVIQYRMRLLAVGHEGGDAGDSLIPSCPRFSEIVQKKSPASIRL